MRNNGQEETLIQGGHKTRKNNFNEWTDLKWSVSKKLSNWSGSFRGPKKGKGPTSTEKEGLTSPPTVTLSLADFMSQEESDVWTEGAPRPTSHCQLVCKASQGTLSQTSQIRVPIINILHVDPVNEYHRPGIKAFEYLGSLVETLSFASSALRHQDHPNLHHPATEDVVRKLEPISQVLSNHLELLEANFAQHQASPNPHGPSADGETAKSLGCQMSIAECDHIVSEMPDRKHEKGVREYSK